MNTLQETGQPGNKKKKNQSHGNPDRHRADQPRETLIKRPRSKRKRPVRE